MKNIFRVLSLLPCDEQAVGLPCSFRPGRGVSSGSTSRYRDGSVRGETWLPLTTAIYQPELTICNRKGNISRRLKLFLTSTTKKIDLMKY